MVMRSEFDAFLLAHSGAEVLEGSTVTGVEEDGDGVQVQAGTRTLRARTLRARYLVGADGAASRVAQSIGLRRERRLCGSLEAEIPLNGGALGAEYGSRAVFALGALPWGYAWIFPKGEYLSVGIAQLRPGRADLRSALPARWNGRASAWTGRNSTAIRCPAIRPHPGPGGRAGLRSQSPASAACWSAMRLAWSTPSWGRGFVTPSPAPGWRRRPSPRMIIGLRGGYLAGNRSQPGHGGHDGPAVLSLAQAELPVGPE